MYHHMWHLKYISKQQRDQDKLIRFETLKEPSDMPWVFEFNMENMK